MNTLSTADPRVCDAARLRAALALPIDWAAPRPRSAVVIYAPGQGAGHCTRARIIADLLGPATLLHDAAPLLDTPTRRELQASAANLAATLATARVLIVDTFPRGLRGELGAAQLAQVQHTVLVQRALDLDAYPDYHAAARVYARRVRPYPADGCEWDGEVSSPAIGYLVRPIRLGPPAPGWTLIGRRAGLDPIWDGALEGGIAAGARFEVLPDRPTVALGAGYNTSHELLTLGLPFALIPAARRFDDPWRRAERLGRAVHSPAALRRFLAAHGALDAQREAIAC